MQYNCRGRSGPIRERAGGGSSPQALSRRIEGFAPGPRPAFGSVRVIVSIGKTSWRTSLFPDKRAQAYLLPLKAEVRTRERIADGDIVDIKIEFDN